MSDHSEVSSARRTQHPLECDASHALNKDLVYCLNAKLGKIILKLKGFTLVLSIGHAKYAHTG
ncbi:unnamed protein product [Gongylonema pulchrum]|uniref:Uncharacterized protein n=1 Tax=Gongylonema pulchrum TaxID=637853 RepID=A0A183DP31_9BILA|nr:unnamed protein product [Gongylonema pulchrum]